MLQAELGYADDVLDRQDDMNKEENGIVAIDGPAGSGKTTLALKLAEHFGFAFLDTGLLYRAAAKKLLEDSAAADDEAAAEKAASSIAEADLDPDQLMTEIIGQTASKVAALPAVRIALLDFQRRFGEGGKGAVLVGRDIGTVVRPDAQYKIFVTASVEQRAKRRCKQLQERGVAAIYADVLEELCQRDARDRSRVVAPLLQAEDAFILDTTDQSIEVAFESAKAFIAERQTAA
jgi:cytidylate kinase